MSDLGVQAVWALAGGRVVGMNFNMQSLAATCTRVTVPTAGMQLTMIRDSQTPVGVEYMLLKAENMRV
jgi:uncharacterized membrane protein YccF (DUF307 family)